jgi:hypothetical protein
MEFTNNYSSDVVPICSTHEGKLEFYCEDCSELICKTCFASHYGHKILPIEIYSHKQRAKIKSMSESLVYNSQELIESIDQEKNQIKLIQEVIQKKSIELKDIQNRINSIENLSLKANDYDLTDQLKFQNLIDFVEYQFIYLKITGIPIFR